MMELTDKMYDKICELTGDVDEIIMERALRDAKFREGLLLEGIKCVLAGEVDVGEALINDYTKATKELEKRPSRSKASCKNHKHMFGPKEKQHVTKLYAVIQYLHEHTDFQFEVKVSKLA